MVIAESGAPACTLCRETGGDPVWHDALLRVVLPDEPDYPGFCRVILNRHAAEMTDLDAEERRRMMNTVFIVEAVLREVVRPHKVNLASLGNAVPHVHWHVIPRALDDRHFPAPVWASPQRERPPRNVDVHRLKTRLFERLSEQE